MLGNKPKQSNFRLCVVVLYWESWRMLSYCPLKIWHWHATKNTIHVEKQDPPLEWPCLQQKGTTREIIEATFQNTMDQSPLYTHTWLSCGLQPGDMIGLPQTPLTGLLNTSPWAKLQLLRWQRFFNQNLHSNVLSSATNQCYLLKPSNTASGV